MLISSPLFRRAVVHRTLLVLSLTGSAQAACTFGTPVVSALSSYAYAQDWTQTVQVLVRCDAGSQVGTVRLSSPGGVLEAGTGQYQGWLQRGADTLRYVIPDAGQLRVVADQLTLPVTVPAGQWGAPTGAYTDTLSIEIEF